MLRVGSLFSGAGLCDLGLSWAGFHHQWFCEVDPYCRSVLARHWPGIPVYDDVRELRGDKLLPVDVLCGGFPCQDVSQGGKHAGIKEGTRSGLWAEYARLIGEVRPRWAVIENVRGLLSNGMARVLGDIAAIGYDAQWTILPAAACGAPHHRERVFLVAYPHGTFADAVRLFAPLQRMLGDGYQPQSVSDWLGVRFERSSKPSARFAFGGAALCRVDDGCAGGLDGAARGLACLPAGIRRISRDEARAWLPRLKALGNGILPQQAYAVGACILSAEGLSVPPCPSWNFHGSGPITESREPQPRAAPTAAQSVE